MSDNAPARDVQLERIFEIIVRIGLVLVLVAWCFQIIRPFIFPIIWGVIIAVAAYPLYRKLEKQLGSRRKLAAGIFMLIAVLVLVLPVVALSTSIAETVDATSRGITEGTFKIPPPSDQVAKWPLIGENLHRLWHLASNNLEEALKELSPQLKSIGGALLEAAAGAGLGILQFLLAIIIAGILLYKAEGGNRTVHLIAARFAPARGDELANLAGATVRSVAQGVLGVAFIQAALAGIAMLMVGVPGAGIWALLVLFLAIVQLPPLLVLGPVILYVFSYADPAVAIVFTIWSILVGASDGVLKPLLLGRGVEVPMLVILLGAIGGMILSGIIGLFVGSVILALGYKLAIAWLMDSPAGTNANGNGPDPNPARAESI